MLGDPRVSQRPPRPPPWCNKLRCSYLHAEQAQHRPHPWFVIGYCTSMRQQHLVQSRSLRPLMLLGFTLAHKSHTKNPERSKMVLIQVDEAAYGGCNSRYSLLTCTRCTFLSLGHLDPRSSHPSKRKNEKNFSDLPLSDRNFDWSAIEGRH